MRFTTLLLFLICACQGPGSGTDAGPTGSHGAQDGSDNADPTETVAAFLDGFHQAAAEADGDRYFGCLAEDGVFLGTDPDERWDRSAFEAAYRSHFDGKDSAWIYVPGRRAVTIEGDYAWFDEDLTNADYGQVRGSGVLRRKGETWEIVQYNLHFTVPNGAAPAVIEAIRAHVSKG